MKKSTIVEIISALFILLFVYTSLNKFMEVNTLKRVLIDYPLIGKFHNLIAYGLPVIEVIVSLLLFIPKTRKAGLYGSLILMSSFTLYLVYMLSFTTKLPCTCGGMLQKMSWPQHLAFNIVCVILALAGIWLSRKQPSQRKEAETSNVVFT